MGMIEKINERINRIDPLRPPFPSWIEIETINRCNGSCEFCPVNVNEPQRQYKKMSERLFRKIIDELAERNYDKSAALYSNNEPLLDERIVEFQKYAKERVPNASWTLFTNGSLLTMEIFDELTKYLDKLVVDNYSTTLTGNGRIFDQISDLINTDLTLSQKVEIRRIDGKAVRLSRGGQAPNKKVNQLGYGKDVRCFQPYHAMIIRPDGKLSLCCNDPLGKYTLGDVSTSTLEEAWMSESFLELREIMLKRGRSALELCDSCDAFY